MEDITITLADTLNDKNKRNIDSNWGGGGGTIIE